MTTRVLTLVALVAIAVYLFRRRRQQGIRRQTLPVSEIGDVCRQISAQGVETSFAVLIIATSQAPVEIQFSIEDGKAGLDWLLMTPENIAEKEKVIEYAASRGVRWQEKTMNEWVYLRVERGDIAGFCTSLVEDLFRVDSVELKYGGFKYIA